MWIWAFGAGDAEGITYDPNQGVLYLVDGVNAEVYRIDPGQNPLFDCLPSHTTSVDTAGFVTDPEGIAFDEATGNLYVVGRPRNRLWEMTTSGALVTEIDISAANEDKPAGITVAPSSQNPLLKNIYLVDRGVDNNSNQNENDGLIFEMARPNNNAPPTANDDSATTPENTSVTIDVAANDVDPEGSLDPSSTNTGCGTCSGPSNGTLVNNGDGTFDYTPDQGFGGPDSFVYEICDTGGLCDTALATVQVGNPPTANDDSAVTPEETLVTIDVAANDVDPEGSLDPTSANTSCATCSGPSNGTLANNGNGTFDYTPGVDFSGGDSFVYEICDATLLCDTATVTITVNPVNDPPVANDDPVSTAEDTLITIDVASNDTDVDGNLDPATANTTCGSCSGPSNGTLVNNGDGTFDYTPDPGFSATDSFVYEICDTGGLCDTAAVTITVGLPTVVEIRVEANSDDAEERLADGSVSLGSSDLELIQEPPDQQIVGIRFNGVSVPQGATIVKAWVQFQVDETTSIATNLTIQGEAVDNAVTFSSSALNISSRPRTSVETAVSWSPPPWETVGEAGPDQQTPDIAEVIQEIVSRTGWSSGNSLVILITGSGERTAESYNGDPAGAPLLHVEYVEMPESSPPVANNDASSTAGDTPVLIDVAANDTDPDGNLDPGTTNTTCGTCSGPTNGTLTNHGNGTFTYTPNPSFGGPDSFVYEICDTDSLCDTATVSIAVGTPPVANDDSASTAEDTAVQIDVAVNDTDADGNLDPTTTNTTCGTCSGPANGSLVNNGNGTFDYTPNPDYSGGDSFIYEICDTAGACDTATVTVTISPVDDPPVANDDSATTTEDTLVVIDVAANDTDADGNLDPTTTNTTCGTCSGPSNGSLVNNGDGTFDYTPDPAYTGPDSFVYEICDTGGLCDTATVTITVSSATHIMVGAGDIARCDEIDDDLTADLLDNIEGTVFTTGDNAYPDGSDADFNDCYEPTWGRHKARTKPSAGNHDYTTSTGDGYYNYFGAAAGNPGEGWYSYDVGDWHIVVLNTNWRCNFIPCDAGSPQALWLQADLAANPSTCTLAYWHYPRFATPNSSGNDGGPDPDYLDLWQILYDAGADVVLNGHRHIYERFALQDPNGNPDPNGILQIIVGTGGGGGSFGTPIADNSVVRGDVPGVLKLTLHPTSYDWEFIPVAGETFTDSGSGTCSGATSQQPPVANDDGYTTDEDVVLNIAAPGVLGNDTDPESDPLTAVWDSGPSNGSLTLNADGSFSYTPDADFDGQDSFAYFANDGTVNSVIAATATITVTAVNDAPVADDQSVSTNEDTVVGITLTASDVDGDPLTYSIVSGPSNGSLSGTPPDVTYTPDVDYNGSDSFTFQANDGGLDSNRLP